MYDINVLAQLGDLKEVDYRNTLAVASLIEVLVDKGVITRREIAQKSKLLDTMSLDEIHVMRMKKR